MSPGCTRIVGGMYFPLYIRVTTSPPAKSRPSWAWVAWVFGGLPFRGRPRCLIHARNCLIYTPPIHRDAAVNMFPGLPRQDGLSTLDGNTLCESGADQER